MNVSCFHCLPKEGLIIPNFSLSDKIALSKMHAESPLQSVKWLMSAYHLNHGDAKYIVMHMNPKQGTCHRCNNIGLAEEYVNCPKCKALNMNWKIEDLTTI